MSRIEPETYSSAGAMLANYRTIHARLLGRVPPPDEESPPPPPVSVPQVVKPAPEPCAGRSLRGILQEVAKLHSYTEKDLLGPRSWRPLAWARWQFFYRALTETSLTLREIGQFCDKHHTTVSYGARAYSREGGLEYPERWLRKGWRDAH